MTNTFPLILHGLTYLIKKKVISGVKMIWFPSGRSMTQMSTEFGPGVKEGKVLKGEGEERFKGSG